MWALRTSDFNTTSCRLENPLLFSSSQSRLRNLNRSLQAISLYQASKPAICWLLSTFLVEKYSAPLSGQTIGRAICILMRVLAWPSDVMSLVTVRS